MFYKINVTMKHQRINSAVFVEVLSELVKILRSISPRKQLGDLTRQRKKSLTSAGIDLRI